MALTEDRPATAPSVPSAPSASSATPDPQGFRPASRRRARMAAGAALAAVAIGGNVLVYSSLDETTEVLQVVTDIRAGEQIDPGHLRTVSVDVDDDVPAIPSDQIGVVVGQYARTYIASGSLIVQPVLQSSPLVGPDRAVIAVELRPTAMPSGLRERSQVLLVIDADQAPTSVPGRVVSRPTDLASSAGRVAISVEVDAVDAPRVVTADEVGVILIDPGVDPATASVAQPDRDPGDPTASIGGGDG